VPCTDVEHGEGVPSGAGPGEWAGYRSEVTVT
jgi:hypothetical protein